VDVAIRAATLELLAEAGYLAVAGQPRRASDHPETPHFDANPQWDPCILELPAFMVGRSRQLSGPLARGGERGVPAWR
jgi:hypothetical protein